VLAAMVHSSRAAHVRAECPATQAARARLHHACLCMIQHPDVCAWARCMLVCQASAELICNA